MGGAGTVHNNLLENRPLILSLFFLVLIMVLMKLAMLNSDDPSEGCYVEKYPHYYTCKQVSEFLDLDSRIEGSISVPSKDYYLICYDEFGTYKNSSIYVASLYTLNKRKFLKNNCAGFEKVEFETGEQ